MADSCRVLDVEENLLDKGDYHLSYFAPDDLEILRSYQGLQNDSLEFKSPKEYSYLKEQSMDIGDMGLTDRQIVAVSLVFYGGIKRNLAAKIMNISCAPFLMYSPTYSP